MSDKTAQEIAEAVRKSSKLMVVLGVLTIVLGVLALGSPLVAGVAVARVAGFLLIAGGLMRSFLAFKAGSFGKGVLAFGIGVLTLLAGVLLAAQPLRGLPTLTLILAVYFVVDGLSEIAVAFQAKPNEGWGWLLFGGVISLGLGLMIWRQWPLSGAWAIGTLVGIKLVFAGWAEIALAAAGRAAAGKLGSASAGS